MLPLLALRRCGWVLLLGSAWLGACSGAHEPTQTVAAAPRADVTPTTNVPTLLGVSIDGLHHRLGPPRPLPAGFAHPLEVLGSSSHSAGQDSVTAFLTGGLTLVASYNARTRQVYDLVVLGHHEDSLMARATLRTNASKYLVLPVFGPARPGRLLGLRIIATD